VLQELQVLLVVQVVQEPTDPQVQLDRLVLPVLRATQAILVLQDKLETQAQQVVLEQMEQLDRLVQQVQIQLFPEPQVQQAQQVQVVHQIMTKTF
jgi:hypothetical protein